jgi:hypothetical protein
MSELFHANSLVPKWSSLERAAIVDAPPALAKDNGSANIRQIPPAIVDAPPALAEDNGSANIRQTPPASADKNGSGPNINRARSISGSRDKKSENQSVDLQKSIDAIDAWPSIHNGW